MIWWWIFVSASLHLMNAIDFTPYEFQEEYKCGDFRIGHVDDRTLKYFYSLVKKVIQLLSKPFPHQEILSKRALIGDLEELKQSFINKYPKWIEFEQWFITLSILLIFFSIVFTFAYAIHFCCRCCCSKNSNKKQLTDAKFDQCRRVLLNIAIGIILLVNVFSVSILIISSQYAEYGANELPQRLGHCIDDIVLYQRDTDKRIRKLLINDFQNLNESINKKLDNGGRFLVQRIKKITGASAIDVLVDISQDATEAEKYVRYVQSNSDGIKADLARFKADLRRLRESSLPDLRECVRNELNPVKRLCQNTDRMLNNIENLSFTPKEGLITQDIINGLRDLIDANIPAAFLQFRQKFDGIETQIQAKIHRKQFSIQSRLKTIGDDLFRIAETISSEIRQMNIDRIYHYFGIQGKNLEIYTTYVNYSWYGTLLIGGIYALIALYFIFALCYGCCGRRPTFYKDDCCVRSTGSKLFACGIWVAVLLLFVLSSLTAVFILAGSNVYSLVCNPLEDPLSRPDMLSLVERYMEMWRSKRIEDDLSSYISERSPADIIRSCSRNETLYQIFGLDAKFHLYDLRKYEDEAYKQLEDYIKIRPSELSIEEPIQFSISPEQLKLLEYIRERSISKLDGNITNEIESEIEHLDLSRKAATIIGELERNKVNPVAIEGVLKRMNKIEDAIAKDLRGRLKEFHENVTRLNELLTNISIPTGDFIAKLQHAHALLSSDANEYLKSALQDFTYLMKVDIDDYIEHVKDEVSTRISSCGPMKNIIEGSRAVLCSQIVDPVNGIWASMLISIICMVQIVVLGTAVIRLYGKIHAYPKYVVQEPSIDCQISAFATDAYNVRDLRERRKVPCNAYCNSYSAVGALPQPYPRMRT